VNKKESTQENVNKIIEFRQEIYNHAFHKRRDAGMPWTSTETNRPIRCWAWAKCFNKSGRNPRQGWRLNGSSKVWRWFLPSLAPQYGSLKYEESHPVGQKAAVERLNSDLRWSKSRLLRA